MKNVLIYLLDQNAKQGNILKYQLGCNGFKNIHYFTTSEECLYAIHNNNHPEFIIMDPGISNLNGLKFLQMVSQIDPGISVIVFSQNDDEADMLTYLNAGATDYIARTAYDHNSLRELISNLQYILKEKDL